MNPPAVTKKDLILFFILAWIIVICIFFFSILDTRTKIVFCNVGQGDAAYIRIKNRIDVLIDAGPNSDILSCLGKHMPFWDRKIEIAFLSHPNSDHYNGYFFIMDRYVVNKFITVDTKGLIVSKTYNKLLDKLQMKKIPTFIKVAGEIISFVTDDLRIAPTMTLYWPPKDFNSRHDNDFSQVVIFQENNFRLLFTGDSSPFVLGRLSHGSINNIDILKIPHHGSKNGLTKKFLDLADPSIAVISVGKDNSYDHPSKQVLDMLKAKKIKILRTDEEGDVIFKLSN